MLVLFSLCLLLAITAVIDVSGSYLRRQAAASLADGAALSVSDAAAAPDVYHGADDAYVAIDARAATAAVHSYLVDTGAYDAYPGLAVDVAVADHTVLLELSMPYRLPVRMPGVPSTATIHANASAQMLIY